MSDSRAVKRLIRKLVNSAGYELIDTRKHYAQDGLWTVHNAPFQADPKFRAAYARGVEAGRGVDPGFEWRVHVALWAALQAVRVPGNFVECGVNAGFISSAIMQRLQWNAAGKTFFLIDTFSGPVLSQYSEEEIGRGRVQVAKAALAAGAYVTDMDRVRANVAEWPGARVVQGAVPDVLPGLAIDKVAFLHLDLNCANPECAALEFFWPRLSPGGIVLFDDYAYFGHDAHTKAIDAVVQRFGAAVLALPTGQGLLLKGA